MRSGICFVALLAGLASSGAAAEGFELNLDGSLGEGGFTRYVPPVSNPIFNETPLITTELRPLYIHQNMPDAFVTDGGDIDILAAQARLAITDRFGLIATTDGYAWVDFDKTLPDSEGWADLAVGLKYAVHYAPEDEEVVTIGARYTFPIGSLDVDQIDLTGYGDGFVNGFVSGMTVVDDVQLQGSAGVQQAVSDDNSSFFYASGHLSAEVAPGFYPLVEFNAMLFYDGGDRVPNSRLTGIDVADFGSSDPQDIVTVAGGARWAATEKFMLGGAFEYNLTEDEDHLFQWRVLLDAVIRF